MRHLERAQRTFEAAEGVAAAAIASSAALWMTANAALIPEVMPPACGWAMRVAFFKHNQSPSNIQKYF